MDQQNPKASNLLNPSPYPLQENSEGFTFTTDNDFNYQIAFKSDQALFPTDSFAQDLYSFSLISLSVRVPVKDPRIEATVADVLHRTFAANSLIIISYVCSLDGDMERHRRILFGQWYRKHGKGFIRLIVEDPINRIYAVAFFKENHPDKEIIEAVFDREYRIK
jgi:hypothetical protein